LLKWKSCNLYLMEVIEGVLWIMTGFSATFVSMELAWRLAKKRARDASGIIPIARSR